MDGPLPFISVQPPAGDPNGGGGGTAAKEAKGKGKGKKDAAAGPGGRQLKLHEEACEALKKIKGDVAVVSIAGLYRTGKSYILNQLAGSPNGFGIGSTIEPCTQGIWLWIVNGAKVKHPDFPKKATLVLLDTEGLGSYTQSKTYDIQIFSLAVLLASLFIYNSMGSIDETALDRLSLVVELSKHIQTTDQADAAASKKKGKHDDLALFFPKFLWLVRDFSLKLESNGREISAKEYLENSLQPLDGDPERVKDRNLIRTSITQYFPDRTCFTLKRPVNDEKLLQQVDKLSEQELRPQFVEELKALISQVYKNARPKRLYNQNLNGSMLVELARNYVTAINSGSVPTIRTAWENVVEVENQQLINRVVNDYKDHLAAFVRERIVAETVDLELAHQEKLLAALAEFSANVKGDNRAAYEQRLQKLIMEHYALVRSTNEAASERECQALADATVQHVLNALEATKITKLELLNSLWADMLQQHYDGQARGPRKDAVLNRALRQHQLDTARRVLALSVAELTKKHEAALEEERSRCQAQLDKLEGLYSNVSASWQRAQRYAEDLEKENKALIQSIVHISEAL